MLQILDPTKVAHQPLGEWSYVVMVITLCFFGIVSLFIKGMFENKRQRQGQENLNQFIYNQKDINAQISQAIMLLSRDRVSELNSSQVKIISRCIIDAFLTDIMQGIMDVIEKNNLDKKDLVARRIDTMVSNSVKSAISYADSFLYEGRAISTMIDENLWMKTCKELSGEIVYTEMDRLKLLSKEIKEIKETLSNDFYTNLKTNGLILQAIN